MYYFGGVEENVSPIYYRKWLYSHLAQGKRKNPLFSLRSFSKRLGVSPATLSLILNGKRGLTKGIALRLADRLSLAPNERKELLQGIVLEEELAPPAESTLEIETFHVISDWYHFATFCLARLKGAKANPTWVSMRLGISKPEAARALARLRRLGLIEISRTGAFSQKKSLILTKNDVPDSALRHHHAQLLGKAEESLHSDPVEIREFGAMTMAIDVSKLPRAKRMIRDFRRQLCQVLESGNETRVYALTVNLFPVDFEETRGGKP